MYCRVLNTRGGRLLIFRSFYLPRTLSRPPSLLILAKVVKSPILFLCIKNSR